MIANTRQRSTPSRWSWIDFKRFLRFEYLPFALILPLIGAASVTARLTLPQLIGLLGSAFALHVFISIENDVVDLPLDRTHPSRADYPLVKGTIGRGQALAIALLQIPIAVGLTLLLGGSAWAYAAIGLSAGMMTIYNLWGKRAFFPPLTDLVQGIGFGAITLYGAAAVGDLTPLTLIVFAAVVAWMMLTNLLGGLRDLTNDLTRNMCTTPIRLGARPTHTGQTHPRWMRVYAYTWQGVMIGLALLALIDNPLGYAPATQALVAVAILLLGWAAVWLLAVFSRAAVDYPTMIAVGRLQMLASSLPIAALYTPYLDAAPLLALLLVFFVGVRRNNLRHGIRYVAGQLRSPGVRQRI
jgi:4-hydroxybenzoate polyprenyltransferase